MAAETLIDTIRRMTGTTASDFPDQQVTDALNEHRCYHADLPLVFRPTMGSTAKMQYKVADTGAWGRVEPATEATTPSPLATALGAPITGTFTLDVDGTVTFGTDQFASGTLYFRGYSYDLHSAAADLLEDLAAIHALRFDFSRGDQKFSRSQVVGALTARADALRRKALPAVAYAEAPDDYADWHGPGLQQYPSRGGNDR